jgi:hypothetical protein
MPAPLGVELALRILVHPTEARAEHQGQVLIQTADGARVGEVGFGFSVEDTTNAMLPGEEFALPMVVPVATFGVPHYGQYSVEVLIDGIHQVSVPFAITPMPQPPSE